MDERKGDLASTDPMLIRAYTHSDPSMVLNGEKIPPVIGLWLGMQLVEKYMKQHSDVSIATLLERTDFGQSDFRLSYKNIDYRQSWIQHYTCCR